MKLFVLGALVLGCVGSVAFTQGPGGGGKRGGGMDPDAAFDRYAKGGNAIVVSEYETDERMAKFMPSETVREWMTAFLQEKGIKNGKLTREDYREYSEWVRPKMMEHFQKMREQGGGGGKGDRKDGGNKDGGNSPQSSEDLDGRARDSFKRLDKNSDGVLDAEEMQAVSRWDPRLYEERDKYDLNKDGKLDVNEYVAYYKETRAQRDNGKGKGKGGDPNAWTREEDDKPKVIPEEKRVVYRIGSMPKDLPAWYVELDKDKDGQVGLYEWKAAGKDLKEFLAMDANGDGFVTVEEIFRFQKAAEAKKSDGSRLSALMPMQMVLAPGAGAAAKGKGKGDWKGKGGGNMGMGGGNMGKGKGKGNR